MISAALSPSAASEAPRTEINLYLRAVWSKLGADAMHVLTLANVPSRAVQAPS
jgi:hypothetical protein